MRARLQLLAFALGIPCVAAGAALAFVGAVLPRPSPEDVIGVKILRMLETTRGGGAVIRLGGRTLIAECRELSQSRRGIFLDDGTRIFLRGTRIILSRSPGGERTLTALQSPETPAAAADLGGSHFLYVAQLAGSIVRGRHAVRGTTWFEGHEVYRVRLGRERPLVELLVDRTTLDPVAAHYRSSRLEGWSRLYDAARGRGLLRADTSTARGC